MAEIDLGKVRLTEQEVREQVGKFKEMLGGVRFGQDEEGSWGYMPPAGDAVIPFSLGSGRIEGTDVLLSVQIKSTSLTTKNVILGKKYKAIAAYGAAANSYYAPYVTLNLETNSIVEEFGLGAGTGYMKGVFRMDLNLDGFNAGDTYAVKASASYSGTAVAFSLIVLGLY